MIVEYIQLLQRRLPLLQVAAILVTTTWLSSCAATSSYTPENAPEYIIITSYTPFYKLGPMQGRPDASLPPETRVKLLRQEPGYSQILLEDSRTGYVANESIAPAPPRPPASTSSDDGSTGRSGKKKGKPNSPAYSGEQLNDIPLPDVNVPAPDLNVGSEDISAPAPTPTPPVEKPKFRY